MIKKLSGWWLRSTSFAQRQTAAGSRFEQAYQSISGHQINIADLDGDLNIGRAKIPPHIERFTYRMDRHPQCTALLDRISIAARCDRPICALAFGIEEDLPSIFGSTVFEYLQYKAPSCDLRAFLPPKAPLCPPWPDNCIDSEELWRIIGTKFLDLPELERTADVHSALENRAGSIAFGFEMDVAEWEKHVKTLITWIDTLNNCRAPKKGVALALIIVSGSRSSATRLQELHEDLTARYEKNDRVLVLPVLGPVAQIEFKAWHREFMVLAANSVPEGDLASMILELFPDDAVPRRMGDIWWRLRKTVHEAWGTV